MSSKSSGKKLEGFFTGKGFYIVLFLCAAVIGVSAWLMAAGNETIKEDVSVSKQTNYEDKRVEQVIVPPVRVEEEVPTVKEELPVIEEEAPVVNTEGLAEEIEEEPEAIDVWEESPAAAPAEPTYVWPVLGEIERAHCVEELSYDVTMRDWRTHDGVDIAAPLGSTVAAVRAGTVESIVNDPLYGTTVIIDHGDGTKSSYANLADLPTVTVGDWVEAGSVIGSVGLTAICEIGQGTHLHFAMTTGGRSVDPLEFLPA